MKNKIIELKAELEDLRTAGVFRLAPNIEPRADGYGREFVFRRRGAVVVDDNVPFRRRIGIPEDRNPDKAQELMEKFERTKQARDLIVIIRSLEKKEERREGEAESLLEKAEALEARAKILLEKAEAQRKQADKGEF